MNKPRGLKMCKPSEKFWDCIGQGLAILLAGIGIGGCCYLQSLGERKDTPKPEPKVEKTP